MPRFFATGSDSESDSSSDQEEIPQRPVVPSRGFAWSDDEEETKRVVRSAKDKRFDELERIIKNIKNHKKIKDMSKVLSDFEDLGKALDKSKKVVDKEGIPRFYIRCLVELEDFVSVNWEDREARKAMSKNNAKGLATLRQKLRRYNRDFENDLAAYRENPDAEEADSAEGEQQSDDESSSDDDDDGGMNFLKKEPAKKEDEAPKSRFLKGGDDEDSGDDDSSYWGSDSDSDSSSDDAYGGNLAAKFLKKTTTEEKAKEKDDERQRIKDKKKDREEKARRFIEVDEEQEEKDGDWTAVNRGAPAATKEKLKMFPKDQEINHEKVVKKMSEIFAARGKKGTNRIEMINLLIELRELAGANNLGPAMDLKILFYIIASIFDYNPNIAACMKTEMWEKCLVCIEELLDKLVDNSQIIIGENVADESECFEGPVMRIRGCVLTLVERMDEEYTKMLQACDAHSTEYVDRLKDEKTVFQIINKLLSYLEGRGTTEELCRCYIKKVEHMYYKFDVTARYEPQAEDEQVNISAAKVRGEMDQLCKYIYAKDNTDRIRARAILCHIYYYALHDCWYEARDLMLMSHLQDTIQHSDVATQIMYNRAMAQLGLCAFRQGLIKDAHNCLVDIQSVGRAKELLAQGLLLQRQYERTAEQEKIEKRRQMPYHMHINLELLECVYLVSAMLIEIPYMAAHEFDARRRMISKNFHHVLKVSERQPLVGPPESMREHVVAASKAMKKGNWKQTCDFLINEKMNAKVWDLFQQKDKIKALIREKLQEESLRTYLFTYSGIYDSLSLDTLALMFQLDRGVVHSVISKMIINEELMASLDEPTSSVVMHKTEPSRLQSLSLQLSEKVAMLVENNERIMEAKQGGGFFFQNKGGQRDFQNRDRRDGDQRDARDRRGDRDRRDNRRGGGYGGYRDRGERGDRDRDQSGYGGRRRQQMAY